MSINLDFIKNINKRTLLYYTTMFILIVFIFSFSLFNYLKREAFSSFEANSANFDLGVKKLPYNSKTIEITFNNDIDEKSINNNIIKVTPPITGIVKLKNANTLVFELSQNLDIGTDYTIVVSKELKSKNGKNLDNDLLYIVKSSPGASVLKVLPENHLENLGANISVFFSLPMVALSTLDLKDELPCPIEISPKVLGKCKWTTSSVVEFTPDSNFNGSTKYDVSVVNKPGMIFQLEKEYKTSFSTPALTLNVPETFLPEKNINLRFNYPVGIKELENNIVIDGFSGTTITKDKESDFSFFVKPSSGDFKYESKYKLRIKNPIKPLNGNINYTNTGSFDLSTNSLISNVSPYVNVYSSTGELIDNKLVNFGEYDTQYNFLPINNLFFKIYFNEEVSLDKSLFVFQDQKGYKYDFDIKYSKIEDENKKIIDDKKTIDLVLKGKLENNNTYKLIVSKQANRNLLKDMTFEYKTPDKLKVLRSNVVDYSKSCIYTNNKLGCLWGNCDTATYSGFSISNNGTLKTVANEEYRDFTYEENQKLESLPIADQNKFLKEKGYCENAGTGEYLYVLDTRLKPNTDYELKIQNLPDIYGNNLESGITKKFKTGNIREKDEYVYSSYSNFSNVYPRSTPVILNFQTINSDDIYVDVCEMGETEYLDYLVNSYNEGFTPKCTSTGKVLKTKNNYWNLTNNKFDLLKDILGKEDTKDYLLISAYPKKGSLINYSQNMIVRTNINMFLEKASNKTLLFATDLDKNLEIPDLKLYFYDFSGKKVEIKYSYNKDKKVYEIDNDLNGVGFINAKNDKYSGILTQDDYFSNYDFKYVSGMDSSVKNYLYIYTDRPIYRPGDEVFIKGILREFNFDGFKKSKIKKGVLKIYSEDNSLYRSMEVNLDSNSNFTGSFIIPKESSLGAFNFKMEVPGDNQSLDSEDSNYIYTSYNFYIEEYKKPTFKVDIESDKNDALLGEKTKLNINPKYYFGGKMVNTNGVYSILTQNYFFDAKEYADYQFGSATDYFDCIYWGYCSYSDHLEDIKDFKISPDGNYNFEYNFPATASGEKIYTFSFDVTDPDTSKTVSNSVSKILHQTDGYVGLKANYYNSFKNGINFDLVFLDYSAKALPYKTAKVEVIKRDWQQVKKLGVDGVFYNDYSLEEKKEKEFTLSGDKDGKVGYNLKTLEGGEYEIRVSYKGEKGDYYTSSSIVYVDSGEYVNWRNDNNTVTDLTSEKTTYKLGETANFVLKSPVDNGKALIVLEKDDGIIDYFIHDIKSFSDTISFKITDKHYPNVYVKALLIGTQKENPLPVYKRALSVVKVLTDYKNLNIQIGTDKKNYNPGDKVVFNIEVLDKDGKPVKNANGSLSVVDESVLALKGNPRKNPYSFFYDMKRYLGAVTYSSLKYLVEKLEVKDTTSGEKGGSGEGVKGGDSKKSRGNFKDTASWVGNFTTDNFGKAIITLDQLPDNLTTWVVEALVNTPDDNKIGVAYETIMTSKELMIEDNLPRFISADDTITLSPVVYNRTGKDGNFKFSISSSLGQLETGIKNVFIKAGESSKVNFDLKMISSDKLAGNDISKLVMSVSNNDNSFSDSITKFVRVLPLNTKEQTSTFGKTTDIGNEEKINITGALKKDSLLKINYAGTLFSSLLDGVDYNNSYPYGCSEQRTSAIMPNIYIKKLYDVSGVPFDLKTKMITRYIDDENGYRQISLDEVIKDYLIEIKEFQNLDGGFAYWKDGNYRLSDVSLTSYILTSLSEIKSLGYKFDEEILSKGQAYLKKEFYDKKVCDENSYTNCLPLDTKVQILLSLGKVNPNDYEVYKMYKLLDFSKNNNQLLQAKLLGNLTNIKEITSKEKEELLSKAKEIISKLLSNNLVFNPRGAFLMGYGDEVLNSSLLLELMSNLGLSNFKDAESITDNIIRFILSSKSNSSFGSTFNNSGVIKSISSYLSKTNELKNTDFSAKLSINNIEIDSKNINKNNIFEVFSKDVNFSSLKNENSFIANKVGTGTLYYDLNLSYYVSAKNAKARDEGFYVDTKYYDYNEYKKFYTLKNEEYQKYINGEIKYEDLVYKKDVVEYLKPVLYGDVGQLLLVYNKVVTNEPRNQVAIESYIPSGSEIVNTNLATESKLVQNIGSNIGLDREEMRDDRYFGWLERMDTGIYNISYTIRVTHSGKFSVSPTKVSEFYNEEVFGRSNGMEFMVR